MDTLLLARLQFATTTSIHFLFVLLTLGLVTQVAIMQTRWAITGREVHGRMARFWGQLYAINYALGIATGIVVEFQFGLSWSGLSRVTGNVLGTPLALETLIAFFLESTFLGLWLFGWNRLNKWVHLGAIWGVTLTAYASMFWVLAANSWMQHPVGYELRDGQAYLTDFSALLTNPNLPLTLLHVFTAAMAAGGFFLAGVSALHFLRRTPERDFFRRSLRIGLLTAASMLFLGTASGGMKFGHLRETQPSKIAKGEEAARIQAEMTAQYGPGDYLPPSWIEIPQTIMLGIGGVLFLFSLALLPLLFRDWLVRLRLPLYLLVAAVPLPFVAAIGGWLFREVGRQPWVVYGVLPTSDAVSDVPPGVALASFVGFTTVLTALAVTNWVLIARAARRGPGQEGWAATPAQEPAAPAPVPSTL